MALLTISGRAALAAAIANETIHFAWGAGDPAWDATPAPETPETTALVSEIGRRSVTLVQFVVEDANGAIVVPDVDEPTVKHRFSPSPGNAPTNHLYMLARFDYDEAPAATVREFGIFIGTVPVSGLPPGQIYLTPDQIASPGILLAIERFPFINRNPALQLGFEQVLTI